MVPDSSRGCRFEELPLRLPSPNRSFKLLLRWSRCWCTVSGENSFDTRRSGPLLPSIASSSQYRLSASPLARPCLVKEHNGFIFKITKKLMSVNRLSPFHLLPTQTCWFHLLTNRLNSYQKGELGYCGQYSDKAMGWIVRGSNPSITRDFLFSKVSRKAPRPTQPLIQSV